MKSRGDSPRGQAVGHERGGAWPRSSIDRLANRLLAALGVHERQFVGRLALTMPVTTWPRSVATIDRPITFHDLARGFEHRLDQEGALVLATHVR